MKRQKLIHKIQEILLDTKQPPGNVVEALNEHFAPQCHSLSEQFNELASLNTGNGNLFAGFATNIQAGGIVVVGKISNAFAKVNALSADYDKALKKVNSSLERLLEFYDAKYESDAAFYHGIPDGYTRDPVANFFRSRLSWTELGWRHGFDSSWNVHVGRGSEAELSRRRSHGWNYHFWTDADIEQRYKRARKYFLTDIRKEQPSIQARVAAVRAAIISNGDLSQVAEKRQVKKSLQHTPL